MPGTLGDAAGTSVTKLSSRLTSVTSHAGAAAGTSSTTVSAGLVTLFGLLRAAAGQSSTTVSAGLEAVFAGDIPQDIIVRSPQARPMIR